MDIFPVFTHPILHTVMAVSVPAALVPGVAAVRRGRGDAKETVTIAAGIDCNSPALHYHLPSARSSRGTLTVSGLSSIARPFTQRATAGLLWQSRKAADFLNATEKILRCRNRGIRGDGFFRSLSKRKPVLLFVIATLVLTVP